MCVWAILPAPDPRTGLADKQLRLLPPLCQTQIPHNGQFGPRRYGLVQHRISPVGTAAPTHTINSVPPPTKCSLFQLVRRRYEKGSLMLTSNQPVGS